MIRFKQTKKFSNKVADKLGEVLDGMLHEFAQETGQITYQDIIEYANKMPDSKKNAKLTYHLNKWNEYIESGQDDKALKKSDDIRAMIRGQKEFSKLRRFSDDKMLFVEYVDEDGDTTHQVMKKSEFEQVKDEARTNRTSGAKLKILTEEVYDETNPKHKKYKDHPVTETKEFSKCPIEPDKDLWRLYAEFDDVIYVSKLGSYRGTEDEVEQADELSVAFRKGVEKFNPKDYGEAKFTEKLIKEYEDKGKKIVAIPDKYFNGGKEGVSEYFTKQKKLKKFSDDREQVPDYIAKEVDENGVIVKYKDSWRIVSKKQKPYEFWDATYDTKEDAEAALAAYHANKGFSNNDIDKVRSLIDKTKDKSLCCVYPSPRIRTKDNKLTVYVFPWNDPNDEKVDEWTGNGYRSGYLNFDEIKSLVEDHKADISIKY